MEHALSGDQVNVSLLVDAECYAYIHLGAHRARSHDFLRGPLGGGHEGHGGSAA